jgi:hypothetical protein
MVMVERPPATVSHEGKGQVISVLDPTTQSSSVVPKKTELVGSKDEPYRLNVSSSARSH